MCQAYHSCGRSIVLLLAMCSDFAGANSNHTICRNSSIVLGLLLASPQSDGHNCRTGRTAGNSHFVMVSVLREDQMICQLTRI